MTRDQAKDEVRQCGYRLRYSVEYREFCVWVGDDESSYYTDDLQDAVDTAKALAAREVSQ
jgi:hypothetical protein